MIHPHIAALLSHPAIRSAIERALAARGQHGDTQIAHVSPGEMGMLKSMGGVGTRNPSTGLPQFFGAEGGSSPDAGGQGLGSGASTDSDMAGRAGAGVGGSGFSRGFDRGGLKGGIRGALGLDATDTSGIPGSASLGSGIGGFIAGGGLPGMAIRAIGDMLGPSQGVAGGYGAASLGGNRGLGGPMSGDRGAGALNRWYQNADGLQQPGMQAGGGGGALPPPMPPPQPPATLAPMMSTTAGQDLTGGAFGALPSWATQPYQVGTAPTAFPVPYVPSQPPPQIYGGQGGQGGQGGFASPLQGVANQGQPLSPQQRWHAELLQRLRSAGFQG